MSDVQLLWLHISMGCVHLLWQTTKLWYCCLLPQRKARSNLTHWCFVVRESSYHEQDSIARYRYMVLDILFFVFGWFKVIILKMYHKVASILLHKCCYIYLSLRDWNTRECSSVSFTLSGKLKKRIKRKREFWAGYCYVPVECLLTMLCN